MAERNGDILSEEEAAQVWRRAAQLQSESDGGVEALELDSGDDGIPSTGYALTNVRSAAQEAGIADEFVEAALTELSVARALPRGPSGQALARKFLNQQSNIITVRKVIEAKPDEVLSAMQAVLPNEPFRLILADQQGDPLDGGALVFDFPGMKHPFERGFAFAMTDVGIRQVFVTLRPIEGPISSCEMIIQGPVTSHNTGFGLGIFVATLTGAAGFGALGAVGLALGMGPVGAIGGVLLGAGMGVKGYRAVYNLAMRRAKKALEGLGGAVAVRTKGIWQG
jgi:hypothetical protein